MKKVFRNNSRRWKTKIGYVLAFIFIILVFVFLIYRYSSIGGLVVDNPRVPAPLMISDIVFKEGVYHGWQGEEIGARIIPARVCNDSEGSESEMDIYIYGGEYPYGDEIYPDYENPENNNEIHFGSVRVTGAKPEFQVYFDHFGTFGIKQWPVWIELNCGGSNFTIKRNDKIKIEYDNGNRIYINIPELNGTGNVHFFVSDVGEVYNTPINSSSGPSLAPKVCTKTGGGDNLFVKGTCTGDLVHEDVCANNREVIEWYCNVDNMCSLYKENCEQKYGTECVNGACQICIPNMVQCDSGTIKTCKADGSGWKSQYCEYGCGSINGLYQCYTEGLDSSSKTIEPPASKFTTNKSKKGFLSPKTSSDKF